MALHTKLPIYTAAYDLFGIVMDITTHMRRDYKAVMGRRIQGECMDIVMLVYRANVAEDKRPHLTELLERLQVIELTVKLACDKKLISPKQYAAVIALTSQVGKQANGWRKDSAARLANNPAHQPVQEQLSLG